MGKTVNSGLSRSTGMGRRYSYKSAKKARGKTYKRKSRKRAPAIPRTGKRMMKAATVNPKKAKMCLEMGGFFPDCMAVSFEAHATYSSPLSGSGTLLYYDNGLRCYPQNYGTASINVVGSSGFVANSPSSITQEAIGFNRLVGSSTPALYKKCLCYKMKYDVVITMRSDVGATLAAASNETPRAYQHLMHVVHTDDALCPAPTTVGIWDKSVVQPDVKSQVQHVDYMCGVLGGTTGPSTLDQPIMVPSRPVRWRGTLWPHKEQNKPFEAFLEDTNNWGGVALEPPIATVIQFQGQQQNTSLEHTTSASIFVQFAVRATYFCLLKDKNLPDL